MCKRPLLRSLLFGLSTGMLLSVNAQDLLQHWWQPDGPVYSVVEDEANGVVYVGGAFEKVGPPMFGGTPLDRNTGLPVHTAPLPNGQAYDVVPDGQGGYYMGGEFTAVDGQPRNRVAHVSASGELLPFGSGAGAGFDAGTVERMLLHDGVLYASHSAAWTSELDPPHYTGVLDGSNGALLWNAPEFDGPVKGAFAAAGGGWYVWGDFKYVGGLRRDQLVRLTANGAVHPWDARINGGLQQIALSGNVLYLTGCFSSVLGQPRSYVAAIDLATGLLLPFSVEFFYDHGSYACGQPQWLQVMAGKVHIYGGYEYINGTLASQVWLDGMTGSIIPDPFTVNGLIHRIVEHNGLAYVLGTFTSINGEPRDELAIVDPFTGALQPVTFTVSGGVVKDLRPDGDLLYLIGTFSSVNGELRPRVAQIDLLTAQVTPWSPQTAAGSVSALELANDVVYISGSFSTVSGEQRYGMAAVDPVSAQLLQWQHQRSTPGSLLGTNGSQLFAGVSGISVQVQSGSRRIVALDVTTAHPTGWSLNIGATNFPGIQDLFVWNDELVLAGCIGSVSGVPRQGLARVNISTGLVSSWSIPINGCVTGVALHGDDLFFCGGFTEVSGEARSGLAAVSMQTGALLPFSASFTGYQGSATKVHDLAMHGDSLYVVGEFWGVNDQPHYNLVAFNVSTNSLLDWSPMDYTNLVNQPTPWFDTNSILGITISGDTVFVTGRFGTLLSGVDFASVGLQGLGAIHRVSGAAIGAYVGPRGRPARSVTMGSHFFVMAEPHVFEEKVVIWQGGGAQANLFAMDVGTGRPHSIQIDVLGAVKAMFLADGYLYLGGSITEVQGQPVTGVARINTATGALAPFATPIPWGEESKAFVVHGQRLFMGTLNGLSVYDAASGLGLAWQPQANARVRALAIYEDVLYMGGHFTEVNGQLRSRLAAIDLLTDALLAWAPQCSGSVHGLSATSTGLAMHGGFGMVQGEGRPHGFAMITLQEGSLLPPQRIWADSGVLDATVVAAHGEDVMYATSSLPESPWQSSSTALEGYHPISGGRNMPYMTMTSNGHVNPWDLWGYGALYHIHMSADRVYFAGQFAQVENEQMIKTYRHNLAVYTRPQLDGVIVNPRVRLGGPAFSAGLMSDTLRSQDLLPEVEPYIPLNYDHALHGGGESADPPVFATAGSTAIVDWVVVELREATDPAQVIATRSALLRRDGQVKDVDGISDLVFGVPRGDYHVAIRHRNHLGVMSAAPLALSRTPLPIDFTDPLTPTFGVDAQNAVGANTVLWPGDANFDGMVKYTGADNDRDVVLVAIGGMQPTAVVSGVYDPADVNLDGTVKYVGAANDRDVILQTIGGGTPTAVRVEQIP